MPLALASVWFSHPFGNGRKDLCGRRKACVFDKIANANVNCDEKAVLSFDRRPHARDKRPLEYPIRLCFPHGERGEESVWRKVPLVRDNRLAHRAHMMSFKQMLVIEDLNDAELPPSTNEDYEPNAADKYNQLGDSTTAAVLDGTVRGLQGMDTFVLVDLGPTTGDWTLSFVAHVSGVRNLLCSLSCVRRA